MEQKEYFREQLRCDFEKVELPETKDKKQGGESKIYQIPENMLSGARKFAKENGLTETMLFFGAYGLLLSKYTGRNSILTGIILRNRAHADTRDMAGMFVNTLPVCLEKKENTDEYFAAVKETMLNLYRYQELPFWEIAEAAGMQDKSAVNTAFVYQADGEKRLLAGEDSIAPEFMETGTSKFDLTMELMPTGEGYRMRLEYDRGKYDAVLIEELAAAYERILMQLGKEKTADISVLSDKAYRKITEGFNDTKVEYRKDRCVHELFEEQAEKTPDKLAVVFEDRKYTYREFDGMVNSLASFLRQKGVEQGDRVAVLLKRDEKLIMAQLAVLKLGAVFIPVDNRYPKDRIEYILQESGAKLIIKNRNNGMNFSRECEIEEWEPNPADVFHGVHVPVMEPCYIIFTSGSTGIPKGCMLTNRGLVNFCINNNILDKCNELEEQICVSVNTVSFDFFIAESLLPLLNGYTVVLASEEESTDREKFAELMIRNRVNIMQTTPTRYKLYFTGKEEVLFASQLKIVVSGGEALPQELLEIFTEKTNAAIFNICGPSECSVWVMGGEQFYEKDITIGRPIANTQIYIVDSDCRILPAGVAGELCIAGDGVGLGYLNRPELTAEKFVENPFATKENGHGKALYHTGDLARWREDGEIEYLGRIDTQVKIRGLRIELGEIENVMESFPGIRLAVAADKRDETGRQYLVGYYTAEGETDEKELRRFLSGKLPKYMVPNYFMYLKEIPMTPSGKTDRKRLPLPDFSQCSEEYAAPVTEREKKLCTLEEELLGAGRMGLDDDFFLSGGDSLTAIEYVAAAYDLGIRFSLQNVFDYPTVRLLCGFLDTGGTDKVSYEDADFEKYDVLLKRNVTDEAFVPEKEDLGNVLLTGGTGFLGAHILDALMKEESGKVYCLVRNGEKESCQEKLQRMLHYYFDSLYDMEYGSRIVPVEGDIEDADLWKKLPADVQTVIHAAASVKHYGSYEYFRKVNREGTEHVIEYAERIKAKLIYISTLSVSGNTLADNFTLYRSEKENFFNETMLHFGQPLENVYVRSKFEAERAVYDAMLSGLPAKVIRIGNLTNRLSDFKFQPNYRENAFLTRVKAVLEFGLLPDYMLSLYSEFSPVDKTAEGIIKLAQYGGNYTVFHLNSNRPLYHDRFLEFAHQLNIPMKVIGGAEFYDALLSALKNAGTKYIFEALQNDMDEDGKLMYDTNIRIENDFTVWVLKKAGFEWNETDLEYIGGYVEYFREIGELGV